MFVGNVIRTEKVSDEESCRVKCYLEPNCVSINVGPAEKDGHMCPINNATDDSMLRSSLTTKQCHIQVKRQVYKNAKTHKVYHRYLCVCAFFFFFFFVVFFFFFNAVINFVCLSALIVRRVLAPA